jgi:hypothetical protein
MGVARPKRAQKAWARWRAVIGRKTLLSLKKKKQKDDGFQLQVQRL